MKSIMKQQALPRISRNYCASSLVRQQSGAPLLPEPLGAGRVSPPATKRSRFPFDLRHHRDLRV
ncbi:hypothetical protein Thiowin_00973 [Thiorhodovibrio winogradskyi]|uniref:Uncharacterized protein n=1 Tax=Thiorhodovibrio winogradskyi TaxID=77007 RepID=A0ABZ0S4R2_9GAMM